MYKNNKTKSFLIPIISLVIVSIVIITSISAYINIKIFENYMQKYISKYTKQFLDKN